MTFPCPCGRVSAKSFDKPKVAKSKVAKSKALLFSACCGRYLEACDHASPPAAESLMRSRYSAFVLGRRDYLEATWHASTRPAALELDANAKWLGLEVRSHQELDANHAEVEFVARYREGSRAVRLHERSRFVRESGRWLYVDGDQM